MRFLVFFCLLLLLSAPVRADDVAAGIAARLQEALEGEPYDVMLSCETEEDCAITIVRSVNTR